MVITLPVCSLGPPLIVTSPLERSIVFGFFLFGKGCKAEGGKKRLANNQPSLSSSESLI
jgi:hypothetical protein